MNISLQTLEEQQKSVTFLSWNVVFIESAISSSLFKVETQQHTQGPVFAILIPGHNSNR